MQTFNNHILKVVKSYMYDPDASDFQNNANKTNYRYDHIGNLVTDLGDSIKQITWTVSGKIKSITRDSLCTTKPDLSFDYDATGNRIAKHVYLKNDDKTINTAQSSHTYYIRDAQDNIMATYNHIGTSTLNLQEQPIYGSSRIGEYKPQGDSSGIVRGTRMYEETNHLGNVLVVFSDRKIPSFLNNDTTYRVHIADAKDYYPFGMEMYGRGLKVKKDEQKYKFGYNGKENDKEVIGWQDYGMREYDTRLARFISIDPVTSKFPMLTPYQFASNSPLQAIDLDGMEGVKVVNPTKPEVVITLYVVYVEEKNQNQKGETGMKGVTFSKKEAEGLVKLANDFYKYDSPKVKVTNKDGVVELYTLTINLVPISVNDLDEANKIINKNKDRSVLLQKQSFDEKNSTALTNPGNSLPNFTEITGVPIIEGISMRTHTAAEEFLHNIIQWNIIINDPKLGEQLKNEMGMNDNNQETKKMKQEKWHNSGTTGGGIFSRDKQKNFMLSPQNAQDAYDHTPTVKDASLKQ